MKRTLILVILLPIVMWGQKQHNVDEIVDQLNDMWRANSSISEMKMDIITPHWERTLQMKSWTQGEEKAFIIIEAPKKDAGTATLKLDNEMWNYLPNTGKVIKIPPSMMMGSWMGSDFTNDDLVRETSYQEDYDVSLFRPEGAEDDKLYLNMIPHEDAPVVWGKVVTTIREADYIPLRMDFYDESGELMRVMIYGDIKEIGGRTIPTTMILEPKTKEGHRTTVTYLTAQFNVNVPDDIFTLRHLKQGK